MRKYEQANGASSIVMADMETIACLENTWKGKKVLRAIRHNAKMARLKGSGKVTSLPTVSWQEQYMDYTTSEGKRIRGRYYKSRDRRFIRAKRS